MLNMIMMMMTMMILVDYHDEDYDDDFHYDDEDSDYGMLGSMVQAFEVATNTAACTTASAADPRGSATNPRPPTLCAQFSAV